MGKIGINSMLGTIDDIKTNKLKFNLLISGKECRTLEEVKENFNIDDIKKYYDSDLLERWLLNNDYKDLYYEIKYLKKEEIFDLPAYYHMGHINIKIKQGLKDIFFPEHKKNETVSSFVSITSNYKDYYNYNDYKNYSTADEYFNNYKKIVNIIINDKTDYIKSYIDLLAERYSYFFKYDYKNFIKKIMENKNYYALFYMLYNDFMRYYLIKDDNVSNFINEKILKNISEKLNSDFKYIKYYSKSESNSDNHFIEISNKECIILFIENASVTSIDNKNKVYNKDDIINDKFKKIKGIRYNWQYNNKIVYIEM
ncbi:hypothetical protein [Brachyspira innocens]|uniref:hypothetical protein n=1 Tax=Brachyspira innocens TaxID=13264 RepID=UPI0026E9C77B|nr:hypothetical protein [Brachyspira innocens]